MARPRNWLVRALLAFLVSTTVDAWAAEPLPGTLLHVRVAREMFQRRQPEWIVRRLEVNDTILGTELTGQADLRGDVQIVLQPDATRAVIDMVFSGTIDSTTVGRHGVVRLHNTAVTQFQVRKRVLLGPAGLEMRPAEATAQTTSKTDAIETDLTGTRGRVVRNIAQRRADQLRAEADAIAARHAERDLQLGFDEHLSGSIATLRQLLAAGALESLLGSDWSAWQWQFSSTPNEVHIVLQRAAENEQGFAPPATDEPRGLVASIHWTLVERALTEPTTTRALLPLFAALTPAGDAPQVLTSAGAARPANPCELKWTVDRQWLVCRYAPITAIPAPSPPLVELPANSP